MASCGITTDGGSALKMRSLFSVMHHLSNSVYLLVWYDTAPTLILHQPFHTSFQGLKHFSNGKNVLHSSYVIHDVVIINCYGGCYQFMNLLKMCIPIHNSQLLQVKQMVTWLNHSFNFVCLHLLK